MWSFICPSQITCKEQKERTSLNESGLIISVCSQAAGERWMDGWMDLREEVHNRWQMVSVNIARSADLEERVYSRLVVTIWASSLAWWDANCYPAACTGTHHQHPGPPPRGGGERLWRSGCRQPASGCVCVSGRRREHVCLSSKQGWHFLNAHRWSPLSDAL